jgi:HSP20 family molecular chaperone IbpA
MTEKRGPAGNLKEIGESAVNTVLDRVGRGVGKVQERRPLAYDLLESEDSYLVVFDAPGATNSDVQVQFREDAVEVKIDRFREFHDEFEMRFPGRGLSLDGRAEFPEDAAVDPTEATATLAENGTLSVHIPKTEESQPVDVADEDDVVDDDEDVREHDEESVADESPDVDHDDPDAEPIEVDEENGDGADADAGEDADADAGEDADHDADEDADHDADEDANEA